MYGIIDIGSNTIRLVIYAVSETPKSGEDAESGGFQLKRVMNKKYTASLASYISRDNLMSAEGIRCATETLRELKAITDSLHLEKVFVFATAPFRNISNTDETVRKTEDGSGFRIRVLTGKEEAAFGFAGMMNELTQNETAVAGNRGLLFDLGGGSTELVSFDSTDIRYSWSLPVGSLNLYKSFVDGILPSRQEIRKIRKQARQELKQAVPSGQYHSRLACCEGGTARAALKLIREEYPDKVTNGVYKAGRIDDLLDFYHEQPELFTEKVLKIAPERIHTLLPGLIVMQCICETFGCRKLLTIESGVREGYLLSELEGERNSDE